MDTHLNIEHRQQDALKGQFNLVELLAALILGSVGMFLALLGVYFDDLSFYIGGWIIIVISTVFAAAATGKAIIEFLSAYRSFREER